MQTPWTEAECGVLGSWLAGSFVQHFDGSAWAEALISWLLFRHAWLGWGEEPLLNYWWSGEVSWDRTTSVLVLKQKNLGVADGVYRNLLISQGGLAVGHWFPTGPNLGTSGNRLHPFKLGMESKDIARKVLGRTDRWSGFTKVNMAWLFQIPTRCRSVWAFRGVWAEKGFASVPGS